MGGARKTFRCNRSILKKLRLQIWGSQIDKGCFGGALKILV